MSIDYIRIQLEYPLVPKFISIQTLKLLLYFIPTPSSWNVSDLHRCRIDTPNTDDHYFSASNYRLDGLLHHVNPLRADVRRRESNCEIRRPH